MPTTSPSEQKPASAPGSTPSAGAGEGDAAPGASGARGLAIFAACAAVGTALDLVTKEIAFSRIGPRDVVVVVPDFVNFIRALNRGAAFSMLDGAFAFFVTVSVAALIMLGWFSWSGARSGRVYQVMLGLVASGVLGNLYDRLSQRAVRDFIDVYVSPKRFPDAAQWLFDRFGTNHWPTFNVADAFICIGTGYLLLKFWRTERSARAAGTPAPPPPASATAA